MGKLVTNTGATVRSRGILYKSVLQYVLLYGRESWVVMGAMLKLLEVFHHHLAKKYNGDDGAVYDERTVRLAPSE